MTIRLLPQHVINQIAAGEVIENPASVVKELVENSLDARATHITVEIKEGGQQLIRVSDNGVGMNREDALVCLERHATSKIETVEDLFRLKTMGFRGEALSSIASISHLTLSTFSQGAFGTRVVVEGGDVLKTEPCARTQGTTIDVAQLFYNVPARKKFQKKPAINSGEITRVLMAMSLAHPEVAFELIQQGQTSFSAPVSALLSFEERFATRVKEVLGEEFTTFQIHEKDIKGFIGSPQAARPNRTGQYLFINRRLVFSQAISYAVKDAFGTTIETNRHPIFVLHLTLDPEEIDANVHPQKKEVRLSYEYKVKQLVLDAVQKSLHHRQFPLFPDVPASSFSFSSFEGSVFREETSPPVFLQPPKTLAACEPMQVIGLFASYLLIDAASVAHRLTLSRPKHETDVLLLVRLDAAAQKIAFEKLISHRHKQAVDQQVLLFPLTLEFSLPDMERILPHLGDIERLGFSARPVGSRALLVDALPSCIKEADVRDVLLQVAEEPSSSSPIHDDEKFVQRVVLRFVKPEKKTFMLQEALELFEALMKTTSPYCDVQGNPTMVYVSSHEIDSFFTKKRTSSSP